MLKGHINPKLDKLEDITPKDFTDRIANFDPKEDIIIFELEDAFTLGPSTNVYAACLYNRRNYKFDKPLIVCVDFKKKEKKFRKNKN